MINTSKKEGELHYVRAEEKIYDAVTDKNNLDWKSFLYKLIYDEGLDPWDIDLGILTKRYLDAFKEINNVDFDLSGKFLTVAVYLLKTKAENLVEKDLRGIEEQIAAIENVGGENDLEMLENLDEELDDFYKKKKEYKIKIRNPIARKRKVNIFDLIKALEKTIEQSNKRKANILARNRNVEYDGPMYERKSKDLKSLIEELYQFIVLELKERKGHLNFSI
jgi:chromatin segregation and condensation protein Rec8/ScpA/Scc1 (kleisin family)